jgi:hypothetical protein
LKGRAVLSNGNVVFADDFEDYAGDVDFELGGWFRLDEVPDPVGRPGESASWTVTNPGGRSSPPVFDGRPAAGRFAISDSDAAGGDNGAPGSGNSNDLWSPSIDCRGLERVWLHMNCSAQLNNNGKVVFDIDASADGGASWTNVYRRVAPSRVEAEPLVTTANSDGYFGRLSVDLTPVALERPNVRFRLRSFEPSDDWWIAVDDVVVDDAAPPAGGSEVLLSEDFSTGLGTLAARSAADPPNSGNLTWNASDPCGLSIDTAGGVFPIFDGRGVHRLGGSFAILDSGCDPDPTEDEYLVTPSIDASLMREVYLAFESEIVPSENALQEVLLSLDGGTTFEAEPIFSYNAGGLFDDGEEPFYAVRTFVVPRAAGQPSVAFAFHYASPGNQGYWAIDDLRVSGDPTTPPGGGQYPGDCNQDGSVDLSDAVCVLGFLFLGSPERLPCGDGTVESQSNRVLLDWNEDASVDLSDAVSTLNWLFNGGPAHVLNADLQGSACVRIQGCPDRCTTP